MKLENLDAVDAIQHWLITPHGSYYGYPNYGNKIHEILYQNRQDINYASGKIVDDIVADLGIDYAKNIALVEILTDREKFYVVITLFNKAYAVGIFDV